MQTIGRVLEITFVLVLAFLVLTHSKEFSQVAGTVGTAYTGAVKTLQGR